MTTITTKAGYSLSTPTLRILSNAPLVGFCFVLIAPYTSCMLIHKEQDVMGLPALPFLSFISNCLSWTIYGALLRNSTIVGGNIIGTLAGCYFTWTYHKYEPLEAWTFAKTMAMPCFALTCASVLSLKRSKFMIGMMCNASSIFLSASPLVQMKKVVEDQDSSTMPFKTSLAFFLNAVAWCLYGTLVLADPFVIIPNCLGGALAGTQLALIAKYPPTYKSKRRHGELLKNADEETVKGSIC